MSGLRKKLMAGFVVATATAGLGTAAVLGANSGAFGQKVKAQVEACEAASNKGECVSDWVIAHNPGASHRHHKSSATKGAAEDNDRDEAARAADNDRDESARSAGPNHATEGKSDVNHGQSATHAAATTRVEGKSDQTHGR